MERERRRQLYEQIDRRAEVPMIVLSLVIIPLFVAPLFFDPSPRINRIFETIGWGIWAIFVAELLVMSYLAEQRTAHLRRRWYELPAIIAPFLLLAGAGIGALGFLFRPLRAMRAARLARSSRVLRLLRASRLGSFVGRSFNAARWVLERHGLQYALLAGAVLYLLSAALIVLFEREEGNIQTYPEALWWAISAMTAMRNDTDFPVTTEGRFVAVFVALLGLTLLSIITANVAAFLMHSQRKDESTNDELAQRLARIEALLEEKGTVDRREMEGQLQLARSDQSETLEA
jgi:voltage-gated potassium channel